MEINKHYIVFTDGSSRGNPGPGGWGSVVVSQGEIEAKNKVIELGGAEKDTTNNKMELTAAIQGLSHTPRGVGVTIYTDSSYVINGITKWVSGWKKNGWQTKAKEAVMNKSLWMDLDKVVHSRTVVWKYVGGHVGIVGNERCDEIATGFADGEKMKLYKGPFSGYEIPEILNIKHDEMKLSDKKSRSSRSGAKAYSYISSVGGVIEVHKSWVECEARVKGTRGARFKKALSRDEESQIIKEFESF